MIKIYFKNLSYEIYCMKYKNGQQQTLNERNLCILAYWLMGYRLYLFLTITKLYLVFPKEVLLFELILWKKLISKLNSFKRGGSHLILVCHFIKIDQLVENKMQNLIIGDFPNKNNFCENYCFPNWHDKRQYFTWKHKNNIFLRKINKFPNFGWLLASNLVRTKLNETNYISNIFFLKNCMEMKFGHY